MHTESLSRLRLRWTERGAGWLAGAALIALAVLAPLLTLGWWALGGDLAHWQHLASYVLPQALATPSSCWPAWRAGGPAGHRLCLAGDRLRVPHAPYADLGAAAAAGRAHHIIAFAYLDLLHPIGPIQTGLRAILGYDSPRQFRLPDLRSIQGAIFVLGFVLYPYVPEHARDVHDAGRQPAGSRAQPRRRPRRRVLPVALLARPAIVVGMSLALLETLNDIGASEFLGVQTLTVSVYTTWVTRSDLAGAAQIALTMLAIVVGLILLERHGRKRQRYANTSA